MEILLRCGVVARIVPGPHEAHRQDPHLPMRYHTGRPRAVIRFRISLPRTTRRLSVSNSLSGLHGELDQVPAVGDPTDIVQLGTGHRVAAGEGQQRVALQRRVAAYLVVVGQTPGATQRCLNSGFSERIGNSRRTGSAGGPSWALLHESSLARTMPTDRILTCRCDTTLVCRGRSSD